MRGLVGLAAAVMVVLVGASVVFVVNVAAPPPASVLHDTRSWLGRQRTASYHLVLTITTVTPDAKLVRQAAVSGVSAFGTGSDFRLEEGPTVSQYVTVQGQGVYVRTASSGSALLSARWVRAGSLTSFEAAASRSGLDAATATLVATLADGQVIPRLLTAASGPDRVGSAAHHIRVRLDPSIAFGPAIAVTGPVTGDLSTTGSSHLTAIGVHAETATASVDASYTVGFGGPAPISPPPQADVVADL